VFVTDKTVTATEVLLHSLYPFKWYYCMKATHYHGNTMFSTSFLLITTVILQ